MLIKFSFLFRFRFFNFKFAKLNFSFWKVGLLLWKQVFSLNLSIIDFLEKSASLNIKPLETQLTWSALETILFKFLNSSDFTNGIKPGILDLILLVLLKFFIFLQFVCLCPLKVISSKTHTSSRYWGTRCLETHASSNSLTPYRMHSKFLIFYFNSHRAHFLCKLKIYIGTVMKKPILAEITKCILKNRCFRD